MPYLHELVRPMYKFSQVQTCREKQPKRTSTSFLLPHPFRFQFHWGRVPPQSFTRATKRQILHNINRKYFIIFPSLATSPMQLTEADIQTFSFMCGTRFHLSHLIILHIIGHKVQNLIMMQAFYCTYTFSMVDNRKH